ncbi:hypothetical protein ACFLVJ_01550 [Chloroflexota bacterium]
MKHKNKKVKATRKLPDFSLEDILTAPKSKTDVRRITASGCTNCGSLKFISRGEVKVFRGERMKVYHCHECGKDFYKGE